ncbi:unnamed protein product [Ilex paraguariensis]|uniref:Agenet domain-containing protein n=1 Tax=Ilex paraguariensis TaxID=185542 RepID=A0ABC8RSP4_9AQUA
MRYKKGSKVEVLSKNEVPSGSWRCAEIINGNGHNYTVKYDVLPRFTDENVIVERVSRRSIRPCPPTIISDNWMPGDVIEVFHSSSWKMATVSMVLGRNYYLVRLVGSFQEFKVSKYDLRLRQSWQCDQWIEIGKGSGNDGDGKNNERSSLKYNQCSGSQIEQIYEKMNLHVKDGCVAAQNNFNFCESNFVSSRTLKRGPPYDYCQLDEHRENAHKFRLIEKEGRHHGVPATYPFPSPEKG